MKVNMNATTVVHDARTPKSVSDLKRRATCVTVCVSESCQTVRLAECQKLKWKHLQVMWMPVLLVPWNAQYFRLNIN